MGSLCTQRNKCFCIAVASFSHARLVLLTSCGCGLISVHEEFAGMIRHVRRMLSRQWIAERLALVGVYYGQVGSGFGLTIGIVVCCMHT